jgi:hypothetical protein
MFPIRTNGIQPTSIILVILSTKGYVALIKTSYGQVNPKEAEKNACQLSQANPSGD